MGTDYKIEYVDVRLPESDPVVLEVIKSVAPGCISSGNPLFWSYSDDGYRIGISIVYTSMGTGTTITNEDQKEEFRSKLKELRRIQKIKQIENEGVDKID